MSVSPLHARHRTPLHAFYRSPLHAFGPGVGAPPSTWTGGTVTAVQNFPNVPNKARHPCSETAQTGDWPPENLWNFQGLEFDLTHPTPYPPDMLPDLYTRTITGLVSGATLRVVDVADTVFCDTASLSAWWSSAGEFDELSEFYPDVTSYARTTAPVELVIWGWNFSLPNFSLGESVTVT